MPGKQTVVPSEVDAGDFDPHLTTARAVGALGLILATVGLAAVPLGIIRFHTGSSVGAFDVGLYEGQVRQTSLDALWLLFSTLIWSGLCVGLLLASIGCLRLRAWARPAMLAWAIATVATALGGGFFYARWLLPPWRESVSQVRGELDSFVNIAAWAVSAALAVMVLICLNRRPVREYFKRRREQRSVAESLGLE